VISEGRRGSWEAAIKVTIVGALIHGVLAMIVLFLLVSVVPTFTVMFSELGSALPWSTQLAVSLATSLRAWWFLWLPGLLLAYAADLATLLLVARWRSWLSSLTLIIVVGTPLLLLLAAIPLALYAPIFATAGAIQ
jgi:type II secretory pathway component PulF